MRRILTNLLALLIIVFTMSGCDDQSPITAADNAQSNTTTQQQIPVTTEVMLASINAGYELDSKDPAVAVFRELLEKIKSKVNENDEQIGDMSVKVKNVLKSDGFDVDLLTVMTEANEMMPYKKGYKFNYAEILAGYETFKKMQLKHQL